jgi:hypothetical protein
MSADRVARPMPDFVTLDDPRIPLAWLMDTGAGEHLG